jgi:hypothetical protein
MIQELIIDLRRRPEDRWQLAPEQRRQARELLALYKADLGIPPDLGEFLIASARGLVRADYWAELESLAGTLGIPVGDAVLCNFYYDALKVVLGCTAFAVDSLSGVLHARNLDWWTESEALSRYTTVCNFVGAAAGEFTTVGWPGFIGAFSGIAPGRFSVTLNAVLSLEPAIPATPVVLVLRSVLEEARSFDEALSMLSAASLPSDSLLLLTGTRAGEHVVIERTPSRCAVRRGETGYTCVTNDYQRIPIGGDPGRGEILATSCSRLERIQNLLSEAVPDTPEACFGYLSDAAVRMQITVQQMVFRANTGEYWVKLPGEA